MTHFLHWIQRLSKGAYTIGGVTLTAVMLITVTDVILRIWGKPLAGTFELVAFCGAIVIGFSIPFTSWVRGHIFVDFLVLKFSPQTRKIFHGITRSMAIALFFLIGWNLMEMGADLQRSGEVSPTLQLPFYPIVFGVGICCFLQCAVLVADIIKIYRGEYE
jgi:TRAP-type C4-dicarboxylate transport system permease small subunit